MGFIQVHPCLGMVKTVSDDIILKTSDSCIILSPEEQVVLKENIHKLHNPGVYVHLSDSSSATCFWTDRLILLQIGQSDVITRKYDIISLDQLAVSNLCTVLNWHSSAQDGAVQTCKT